MTATERHQIYLSTKNDKMKPLKIQARRIFNICYYYGIQVESNEELNCFILLGDIGAYTLQKLNVFASDCNMIISLVDSKLTLQYIK